VKEVKLYIPKKHLRDMLTNKACYRYEVNGLHIKVGETEQMHHSDELDRLKEVREPTASSDTIFVLTKEDVIDCAREMGIPAEAITDDVLRQVKKGVEFGFEFWSEVVKEAINFALKN
jgi:hypothetical protein